MVPVFDLGRLPPASVDPFPAALLEWRFAEADECERVLGGTPLCRLDDDKEDPRCIALRRLDDDEVEDPRGIVVDELDRYTVWLRVYPWLEDGNLHTPCWCPVL